MQISVFLQRICALFAVALSALPSGETHASGADVHLYGYADNDTVAAYFICDDGNQQVIGYQQETSLAVGKIQKVICEFETHSSFLPGITEDFELGAQDPNAVVQNGVTVSDSTTMVSNTDYVWYDVSELFESTGPSFLNQGSSTFNLLDQNYFMSYGVTSVANPFRNNAYVYIGPERSDWLTELQAQNPNGVKFSQLVLPGAHDAGMFQINNSDLEVAVLDLGCFLAADAASAVTGFTLAPLGGLICTLVGIDAIQLAANVAATQKDAIATQLAIGVRYFDMRPGFLEFFTAEDCSPCQDYSYADISSSTNHVHMVIEGADFATMLTDVNNFLVSQPRELVVLNIQGNGIHSPYRFINPNMLIKFLEDNIDSSINVHITDDLTTVSNDTVQDLVDSGKRLIVKWGGSTSLPAYDKGNITVATSGGTPLDIMDSYNLSPVVDHQVVSNPYEESINETKYVLAAVNEAAIKCASPNHTSQFTVLQLQNTATAAMLPYIENTNYTDSWVDTIVQNSVGSLLQATKPLFDNKTYSWLAQSKTSNLLARCPTMVVLQNDFVDPALVSRAIALTQFRVQNP